jgi:hypothetical protein
MFCLSHFTIKYVCQFAVSMPNAPNNPVGFFSQITRRFATVDSKPSALDAHPPPIFACLKSYKVALWDLAALMVLYVTE